MEIPFRLNGHEWVRMLLGKWISADLYTDYGGFLFSQKKVEKYVSFRSILLFPPLLWQSAKPEIPEDFPGFLPQENKDN